MSFMSMATKFRFLGLPMFRQTAKKRPKKKFGDDVTVYKQIDIGDVEEVDEMPIDLD